MPRYHFDIFDGHDVIDDVGTELPTLEAARRHALRRAGAFLEEHEESLSPSEDWRMEVRDHFAQPLFRLSFTASSVPWVLREMEPATGYDGPDD